MARPIKETPILFGEDARRFEARMNEKRTESPEARERRLYHYNLAMQMLAEGEKYHLSGRKVKQDELTKLT